VIEEKAGKFDVVQTLKTADGARTMGLDRMRHEIFLPTAEMEPAANGKRPQMKPGTFEIVVVGKK
jgi:adenosylcobinamide amidohydrolase